MSEDILKTVMLADRRERETQARRMAQFKRLKQIADTRFALRDECLLRSAGLSGSWA